MYCIIDCGKNFIFSGGRDQLEKAKRGLSPLFLPIFMVKFFHRQRTKAKVWGGAEGSPPLILSLDFSRQVLSLSLFNLVFRGWLAIHTAISKDTRLNK